MLGPDIDPRMKQAHEFTGMGIESGDVRALKAIAMEASKCKVLDDGWPTVLNAQ